MTVGRPLLCAVQSYLSCSIVHPRLTFLAVPNIPQVLKHGQTVLRIYHGLKYMPWVSITSEGVFRSVCESDAQHAGDPR